MEEEEEEGEEEGISECLEGEKIEGDGDICLPPALRAERKRS